MYLVDIWCNKVDSEGYLYCESTGLSFSLHTSPHKDNTEPVNDLHEGNEAEAQEQTKHSAKRGDEIYDGHPLASLIFF